MELHPDATLGFLDGASVQNRPNHARMLATPRWEYGQGSGRRTQPLFGFMSLNGNNCVSPVRQAKTDDLMEFMQCIRCANNDGKPIGVVLDNAAIHKAKAVMEHCCQLDIHLIRLPPYSPSLNPIEYLWKDGKKLLSKTRDFDEAKSKAHDVFIELMVQRKHSYAKAWKRKFANSIS